MSHKSILTAAAVFFGARFLLAQGPPEERIPIRDPDRLEELGFPRDATSVYVWSKADLGRKGAARVEAPESWGTATGYTNVFGHELGASYGTGLYPTVLETHCQGHDLTLPAYGFARVPLPDGALLKHFKAWAYDATTTQDIFFQLYEQCQAEGPVAQTTTLIGEVFTGGAPGDFYFFDTLNDLEVNGRECGYTVRVRFAGPNEGCEGGGLQAQKIQVSWVRAVSPAPPAATFNDVPTSHPFFQFVEALATSGITAGCGGGDFCPDAPLTRGQMAVFLAKALGLQRP
jgi:hypothetical protein